MSVSLISLLQLMPMLNVQVMMRIVLIPPAVMLSLILISMPWLVPMPKVQVMMKMVLIPLAVMLSLTLMVEVILTLLVMSVVML